MAYKPVTREAMQDSRIRRNSSKDGPVTSYFPNGCTVHINAYTPAFNSRLRRKIRERDNYTCQICERKQTEFRSKRDYFPVHHINYKKQESHDGNLITLCPHCHWLTSNNRSNNREYWQKRLLDILHTGREYTRYESPESCI